MKRFLTLTIIASLAIFGCDPGTLDPVRPDDTEQSDNGEGNGNEGDVELLEELCKAVKDSSLCGLGQTAPNPILTTIRYFRNEYDAHIREKKCPAHECAALLHYHIDEEKCKGCTLCARKCPAKAIDGIAKKPHVIRQDACIKCGQCYAACRFGAVTVE